MTALIPSTLGLHRGSGFVLYQEMFGQLGIICQRIWPEGVDVEINNNHMDLGVVFFFDELVWHSVFKDPITGSVRVHVQHSQIQRGSCYSSLCLCMVELLKQ